MKRRFVFLLVLCLVLSMGACAANDTAPSGDGNPPATADPAPSASTEDGAADSGEGKVINWMCSSAESETWVQGVLSIADSFAETHPGFELRYENATDQAARSQKIKIQATSNALSDWVATDSDPFMQGLAKNGDIVDVKALIEELGATDDFYEIAYKFNAFDDGSLYFFSFLSVMEYFWFHPSHFEQAGVTKADFETFDGMTAALQKLQDAGLQPLGFCSSEWYVQRYDAFIPFRLGGNSFIDQLKYNQAQMSSDTGMAAAEWLVEISPYLMEGWAAMNNNDMVEAFLAGNCSMIYYGTWDPTVFIEDGVMKDDIDYVMLPMLGGGRDVNKATDGWCNSGTGTAFSTAGMDEISKEFIAYIIDELPATAVEYGFLPAVKPTDEQIATMPAAYQVILNDVLNVEDFGTCWDINVDPVTYETLGKETVNLMLGQITPEEFCQAVDDAVAGNAETYWASLQEE